MSISKAQALGIVFRSADTYAQELENRNLLFICVDKHGRTSAFETAVISQILCKFQIRAERRKY